MVIILLFALYVLVLQLARAGRLTTARSRVVALAFPVLFNIGLLFDAPVLSVDLFTYLAFGYMGTLAGGNPYLQPTRTVGDTSFAHQLVAFGWSANQGPSPYGPLWNELATAIVRLTHDAPAAVLLTKGVLVGVSLGSAVLIWLILARVRPGAQFFGTVAYLWNPLIILEIGAEGHNDALLSVFTLGALAACVYRRPGISLVAVMLGAVTKYLSFLLLPAQLIYLWRVERGRRQALVMGLVLGTVLALAIGAIAFSPYWVGLATFRSVIAVGTSIPTSSPQLGLPPILSSLRLGAFVVFLLIASWQVRTVATLLSTCAAIVLVYAALGSPLYWPWYAILPATLLSLWPHRFQWVILVLSVCAELQAPGLQLATDGITTDTVITWTSRVARVLPLLTLLLVSPWPRRTLLALRSSYARAAQPEWAMRPRG